MSADIDWIEHNFDVGEFLFLRFQPYKQSSIKKIGSMNLNPRFNGPYRIMHRVGEVSYELEIPEGRWIHNVFHVCFLKKVLRQFINTSEQLPPLDEEGYLELVSKEVLEF
jgi:hypothetical protein